MDKRIDKIAEKLSQISNKNLFEMPGNCFLNNFATIAPSPDNPISIEQQSDLFFPYTELGTTIAATPYVDYKNNLTLSDDLMDAIRNSMKDLKEYEQEKELEEKNMSTILNIYKERKLDKIDKEYDEKITKLRKEDEIQQVIEEMQNQVNVILNNDDPDNAREYTFDCPMYTNKTVKQENELLEEKSKEIKQLNGTIQEIKALFELTTDYTERMKILKNYNVVDKNGKLVI